MMATLKSYVLNTSLTPPTCLLINGRYFDYNFDITCGLPSITLQGTKADWENILARIDKLDSFGAEPSKWADLLRPILRRFIRAFEGERDLDFWQRIVHVDGPEGCGLPDRYSGWITAFFVWSSEGVWIPSSRMESSPGLSDKQRLTLDKVQYPALVPADSISAGYAEVDVTLIESGAETKCKMVAGHVAYQVIGTGRDGIRPFPAWFMFTTKSNEEDKPASGSAVTPDMQVSLRLFPPLNGNLST